MTHVRQGSPTNYHEKPRVFTRAVTDAFNQKNAVVLTGSPFSSAASLIYSWYDIFIDDILSPSRQDVNINYAHYALFNSDCTLRSLEAIFLMHWWNHRKHTRITNKRAEYFRQPLHPSPIQPRRMWSRDVPYYAPHLSLSLTLVITKRRGHWCVTAIHISRSNSVGKIRDNLKA